ncbi:MAG: recombinase family protein [Lachnospiraceae bacterium]|nr:recombinase family protein [Lachnospiraceae bacterium]
MNMAYIRVSTTDQNEARQKEALKKYNIEKWYIDKVSGKDTNRPELKALLEFAREGDTVYINEFSRLARNTKDLLEMIEFFEKKGIKLISNKETFDTSTPTGKMFVTMIAAIAEFERQLILERQREGIAIAKAEGKYRGRQVKEIDKKLFDRLYNEYRTREINKKEFAASLHVSRPTLDRLLKDKVSAI